jgi:uncharacterized protein (DUF2267 family)
MRSLYKNKQYKGEFQMNKTDLISVVAEKTDFSKKDSEKAVSAVFDAIEEALANNDKVATSVSEPLK